MRLLFVVVVVSILAGCAGSGTKIQAECETKFKEFPEIFQCTYDNIASRIPGIFENARAKLYLLRGEQLALAVIRQQMSSLDAKIEWQRLYVDFAKSKRTRDSFVTYSGVEQSAGGKCFSAVRYLFRV